MKFIQKIVARLLQQPVKPLGRWTIDYCNKTIDQKIDRSNEDHCGPCGDKDFSYKSEPKKPSSK